jgi:predicted transposase/invertase (TIGR01784 family)
MANANRTYKSSVFTSYFSDGEKLIEAYNAIEGKDYPKGTTVLINTLEDALFMERINDISFLLAGKLIVLIEHQSSVSENLPLRMLLYICRLYEKVLDNDNIYRQSLVKIPRPDFIVLYNGDAEYPDKSEMRLSDAFEDADIPDLLELSVRVYNINQGHNREMLQRSKSLSDYAAFTGRVRENKAKGLPLDRAIGEAVKYCISAGIMKNYLESNASEVENMLFTEFNIDDAKRVWQEEAMERGLSQGLERGLSQGLEKGIMQTAKAALARGFSVSDVADITGLDRKAVAELKDGGAI